MKKRIGPLALLGVAALGIVACDDAGTDPDRIDDGAVRADVALVAADGVFEDLSVMLDPALLALAGSGPALAPAGVDGSFSFTREVTFYDENGAVQETYDPLLTASIHVEWDLDRSVELPFWTADVHRTRSMTVTGLLGEETERTWNGTAAAEVFRSHHEEDLTRSYDMEMEATFEDVVRRVPRLEHPYPLSGTITRHVHVVVKAGEEVLGERDVTVVITFDGTSVATMTVDGEAYEIDLSQWGVRGRIQRKGG